MQDNDLFGLALGLEQPWFVEAVRLDVEARELELILNFRRGGTFLCSECGAAGCKAYDSEERRWRHLDFFQYRTTLVARTPRATCPRCGVRPVDVPWARTGSGFTLLFEALILRMAPHMPVAAIARLVGEHDTRLWRLLTWYTDQARAARDDQAVTAVGVDEKAIRRGHNYVSVFVDLAPEDSKPRVLFVAEGRRAETVRRFAEDLRDHGGDPAKVREVCCDMSPTYISGIESTFANAAITFDKYHTLRIVSDAVDQTRREERKQYPELKGHRYATLRKPETMSDHELEFISGLLLRRSTMKTARAVALNLSFRDLYEQSPRAAERYLTSWYNWAIRSRVPAMVDAARTIKRHWSGVLRWFVSRINNGILEAINSLIQAAKAKARGYRSLRNLTTMIYLIAGRLDFNATHLR